jgi:hypothetical protein
MIKMGRKMNLSLPLLLTGIMQKTFGGTTFLTHAVGGTIKASEFGINGGWGGLRTNLLTNLTQYNRHRGQFYKMGKLEIKDIGTLRTDMQNLEMLM